jgi:hypothetical protein
MMADREPERPGWAHPALTGLTASQRDQLIAGLATPYQAQREAALYIARGGPPTRKPAVRHPPALTLAEQILITVLRQRFRLPRPELAELFGVVTGTIAKAERQAGRCWNSTATNQTSPGTDQDPGLADRLRLSSWSRADPESQTSVLIICERLTCN